MRYIIVSRCLGLLLLVAATLKLHGLAVDPAGRGGVFSAVEWQVAVVEFELLLGFWLLSGNRPLGSWFSSLMAFGIFAGASFYQGWVGQASCGCFGAVAVNPWLTFCLDVGVLVVLLIARPDMQSLREQPRATLIRSLWPIGGAVVGTMTILTLLAGAAHAGFGSTRAAIAYLRGERLSVSQSLFDLGHGEPGDTREASVELTNWTAKPIRIVGGTSDCSCIATADLPVTIPPGESLAINVKMRLPGSAGIFSRTAFLMTDDDKARTVEFRLTGRIVISE